MLVIAGLSLKNLKPRVWDAHSPHYVAGVQAVMVSYAELHALPARRAHIMDAGLHEYLGVPTGVRVYLDNGAFYFLSREGSMPRRQYEKFVERAKPDWYPIPREFIPHPAMSAARQRDCFTRTMAVNRSYDHDGFVPVMHVGRMLPDYIKAVGKHDNLRKKARFALGGVVPNLLRAPKALPYRSILAALRLARSSLADKNLHVFGMGGTATVHIAGLLGFDSLDSSGWRNRAARGIVQLPGSGDRMVANLGSWRGREPDAAELKTLRNCLCPACRTGGLRGLKKCGLDGFSNRACHNLWVLLKEAEWVRERLARGTYGRCYRRRLDNTIYAPLIEAIVKDQEAARR